MRSNESSYMSCTSSTTGPRASTTSREFSIGKNPLYRTMKTLQGRGWIVNLGKSFVIISGGHDVLEEHRYGILEWIEYAVRGREDVASFLR